MRVGRLLSESYSLLLQLSMSNTSYSHSLSYSSILQAIGSWHGPTMHTIGDSALSIRYLDVFIDGIFLDRCLLLCVLFPSPQNEGEDDSEGNEEDGSYFHQDHHQLLPLPTWDLRVNRGI